MRGTNSNHVKVLIDGIDVSDPSNPARASISANCSTADIERIEVLRGPQSGLYGADAMGGVISVITKQGRGAGEGHGTGRRRIVRHVQPGGRPERLAGHFNYAFNVAHSVRRRTPVTPPELLPPGRRTNRLLRQLHRIRHRLGVDPNENFSLNWFARYTEREAPLHRR